MRLGGAAHRFRAPENRIENAGDIALADRQALIPAARQKPDQMRGDDQHEQEQAQRLQHLRGEQQVEDVELLSTLRHHDRQSRAEHGLRKFKGLLPLGGDGDGRDADWVGALAHRAQEFWQLVVHDEAAFQPQFGGDCAPEVGAETGYLLALLPDERLDRTGRDRDFVDRQAGAGRGGGRSNLRGCLAAKEEDADKRAKDTLKNGVYRIAWQHRRPE
jgi:hypothetical protein